jgi:hypothetical protein
MGVVREALIGAGTEDRTTIERHIPLWLVGRADFLEPGFGPCLVPRTLVSGGNRPQDDALIRAG